jgi:hypothetical protein
MTIINNEWITLTEEVDGQVVPILYKGSREIIVQRKFAGLNTEIAEDDNSVIFCYIGYYQRELYPNGDVLRSEKKWYSLQDLTETINDVEGWKQEALAVLTGFINNLGYPGIINPARDTLMNHVILPVDSANGYALRNYTREKLPL